MKILHLIPSLSPVRGGPSQAILEMVHAQRQQGVDAVIATTNDHGHDTLIAPYGQIIESGTIPALVGPSVPVGIFPRVLSSVAALREFAIAPTLAPWLSQHLATFDLVHIHAIFNYPTTLGMAIAQAQGIPYVVRPLGSLGTWALAQGKVKKQAYLNLGGRRLLRGCGAFHFTSSQEQQEAWAAGFDGESWILPHGVSVPPVQPQAREQLRQRWQIPDHHRVILFLSRLHPKKGIEHLIDALATLPQDPFTLVIAGSGDAAYTATITRRLQALGLTDHVRQVGFVTGETKACLLQGSDLFVLPSYSENLGIAVLEAMAAGLPVITTPEVAIAPLIQQHHTGLITPAQPSALATAIHHYLHHPQAAKDDGERGRTLVQADFSWPTQAARLIAQYSHLIANAHPILTPTESPA